MAIQIRRGTQAQWEAEKSNIVAGEPAISTDTGNVYVGTGSGTYTELANVGDLPEKATATPLMDGTASVGSSVKYAAEDHVHPKDTSKADNTTIGSLSNLTTTAKNNVVAAINEIDAENSDIKGALDGLVNKAKLETNSAGYKYLDFSLKAGRTYLLKNESATSALVADSVASKSTSAQAIQVLSDGTVSGGFRTFICSADAEIIRVYFTTSDGVFSITEVDTQYYYFDNYIKGTYDNLISERTVETPDGGTYYIQFPFKAENSYSFKIQNAGCQLIARSIPSASAETSETITGGTIAGSVVTHTFTNNLNYLCIISNGAIQIEIKCLDSLYENAEISYKKPYQSGQIHFTVPVNQKRLYDTQTSDDESDIVNVNCVCMLPSTYKRIGEKTKLIMICHGSGGGVSATEWFRDDATVLAFFQKFLDAGYAIFDCNGYENGTTGQENFGVDTAVIAYHKAYEYMINNYNVEEQFSIYGFSMGALCALNYADMFPVNIKSIGLGSPLVSIYKTVWVDYTVQAKGDVATAYGFNNSTTYEAEKVGNCDPYTRIKEIDNVEYCFDNLPTVKVWHGEDDTATSPVYSKDFIDALNNAGSFAYYRLVQNAGHEICYGGNATISNEIITYFNRF